MRATPILWKPVSVLLALDDADIRQAFLKEIAAALNSHDAALELARAILQVDAEDRRDIPERICKKARRFLELAGIEPGPY